MKKPTDICETEKKASKHPISIFDAKKKKTKPKKTPYIEEEEETTLFLYCEKCGCLLGITDDKRQRYVLDGNYCSNCGKKIEVSKAVVDGMREI